MASRAVQKEADNEEHSIGSAHVVKVSFGSNREFLFHSRDSRTLTGLGESLPAELAAPHGIRRSKPGVVTTPAACRPDLTSRCAGPVPGWRLRRRAPIPEPPPDR